MTRARLTGLTAILTAAVALSLSLQAPADGPKDNLPDNVRPIPPKGIALPAADRKELQIGLAELRDVIDAIPAALGKDHPLLELLPDVEVYHKAVRYSVEYDEFFNPKEVEFAWDQLKAGLLRAAELKVGQPSWPTQTGLVVRGYRSRIDGSVQPYGLVVPEAFAGDRTTKRRLDVWWHGRGETLSEVNFIRQRSTQPGEFTPDGAFVLHPYGRYCNANKFAGEIDTFECLEHAKKHYPIDENRLVARGFSMGGAACWQFAVHYPTLWAAAAPGAGFAETREFLNNFQNEKVKPEWWEQRLWRMYDATEYAQNLVNLPTVAYSGELDRQKQAADVMAREMKKVGLELTHVIGPKTGHKYEPGAKAEINRRIDAIVQKGRRQTPTLLEFQTSTLRYNRCGWVVIDRLERHWEPARVLATLDLNVSHPEGGVYRSVAVETKNVSAITLSFGPGEWPGGRHYRSLDQQTIKEPATYPSDRSNVEHYRKIDGKWERVTALDENRLAKRHGLQGPIDDAFMDRFLMVRPTGQPLNEKVGAWAAAEMTHAVDHWRKQFRGDASVKDDTAITDDDIRNANLILWGDPLSNAVLAKIADRLPVTWTKDGVVLGDKTYAAATHVPVLIFPNPLNPAKYAVLNSGFTFREYDYLNNARQVPKLPDYAVLDITTPPNSRWPGKVVRAGFFGEKWELLPNDGR